MPVNLQPLGLEAHTPLAECLVRPDHALRVGELDSHVQEFGIKALATLRLGHLVHLLLGLFWQVRVCPGWELPGRPVGIVGAAVEQPVEVVVLAVGAGEEPRLPLVLAQGLGDGELPGAQEALDPADVIQDDEAVLLKNLVWLIHRIEVDDATGDQLDALPAGMAFAGAGHRFHQGVNGAHDSAAHLHQLVVGRSEPGHRAAGDRPTG
ncbi:hypothetical protein D3C86_1131870 [compost metagenome]